MFALTHLLTSAEDPAATVAWRGTQAITRGEFRAGVAQLVHALTHAPGSDWLVACPDPLDFAQCLFALWHAGKRAVTPASLRPGAVEEAAVDCDGVLTAPNLQGHGAEAPLHPLDAETAGIDLHTSGSSGTPKRIRKTLRQLNAEIAVLETLWGETRGPVLATVPHHHIYGLLFRLLWPLAASRPFDTETCAAPEILLARLHSIGPGIVISSPSQLSRMDQLVSLERFRGHIQRIYSSGGPLPAETAARFRQALGRAPTEVFGSTETGGIAWRERRESEDAWTPLPGVGIDITTDGALTLTSPFLHDPHPTTTSDAAVWAGNGRFRLVGRLDRIVKIEEKRLSLDAMEARLGQHPWVAQAGVIILPGARQRVATAVALTQEGRTQLALLGRLACANEFRRHLGQWFDAVLLPRVWRYPEALPYNERGKLAAADLARLFASNKE